LSNHFVITDYSFEETISMNKYSSVQRLIEVTSLMLSFIFQESIIHFLKHANLIQRSLSVFTVSLVIILIIFFVAEFLLKQLLNLKIVRKFILRQDYIEGQWAFLSYYVETNEERTCSVVTITGKGDIFFLSADVYDAKTFEHIGFLHSTSAHYETPDLNFNFNYELNNEVNTSFGIAKFKFSSNLGRAPEAFTGFALIVETLSKVRFSGRRINEKTLRKMSDPKHFRTEFTTFINQMKTQNSGTKITLNPKDIFKKPKSKRN
jgi:hypothetical protein